MGNATTIQSIAARGNKRAKISERVNSDPLKISTIQQEETSGKGMSELEQSMNNPSKKASN